MFASGLAALTLFLAVGHVSCQAVGESVCTVGYIMDKFCIDLGVLLDNSAVRTLENPEKHSLHCLLDVSFCVESGYEVLIEPTNAGELYKRGFRLDENGNDMVVELARDSGETDTCTTCTNKLGLSMTEGFRATVKGTISALPDGVIPATIAVTSVEDESVGCGDTTASTAAPISTLSASTTTAIAIDNAGAPESTTSSQVKASTASDTPVEDPSLLGVDEGGAEDENRIDVISDATASERSGDVDIDANALANEASGCSKTVIVYWRLAGALLTVLGMSFA